MINLIVHVICFLVIVFLGFLVVDHLMWRRTESQARALLRETDQQVRVVLDRRDRPYDHEKEGL